MINYGFGVSLGPITKFLSNEIRFERNKTSIWKWCRQRSLISDYEQDVWYEKINTDNTIKMFCIHEGVSAQSTTMVGVCGFTDINLLHRRAEFSLYIFEESQKNGFGNAALKTLVKHGFEDWNFNIIWGESFDKNPATKMFKSLGFKQEGTRKQFYFKGGKFIDAHLFSITKDKVDAWKS